MGLFTKIMLAPINGIEASFRLFESLDGLPAPGKRKGDSNLEHILRAFQDET